MRRRRNPSKSNPYGIDDRVWSRIIGVGKPTPQLIIFAACMNPDLIGDNDPFFALPRSLNDAELICQMTGRQTVSPRSILIKWIIESKNSLREDVQNIARFDMRLGVWCAAACAAASLHLVSRLENRPRVAVQAARDWVLGLADAKTVSNAADRADTASSQPSVRSAKLSARASRATPFSARVVYDAAAAEAYASRAAAESAAAASFAARAEGNDDDADIDFAAYSAANAADEAASAVRDDTFIRDVIARAIESYPVAQP